jgi:hypothetical protein
MTKKVISKMHKFTGVYAKPIVWTLLFAITFSLFTYIYGINRTVRNAAELENLHSELATLRGSLSELEFKQIHLQNGISLEMAHKMGFTPVAHTAYVSRKSSVALLSSANSRQQ